ncbi:MAG TPA: hypothetical protein VGC13_04340 [Longimicrobium sp.]|jgi:hypothetical protein|uniref:hypothetical protein n=1 Tax=Longimicrobium sp. TaxID=2029185 RepID=UPI002ED8D602
MTTLTGTIQGDPHREMRGNADYAFSVLKSDDGLLYRLTYSGEAIEIALPMLDGETVRVTGRLREGTSITVAAGFKGEMAPEETEFAPPSAPSPAS